MGSTPEGIGAVCGLLTMSLAGDRPGAQRPKASELSADPGDPGHPGAAAVLNVRRHRSCLREHENGPWQEMTRCSTPEGIGAVYTGSSEHERCVDAVLNARRYRRCLGWITPKVGKHRRPAERSAYEGIGAVCGINIQGGSAYQCLRA